MKNKIVKRLLRMCILISLVVTTPRVSWASNIETAMQENNELVPDKYIENEKVYGKDDKLSFTYQYEYNDKYQLIEKKCIYPDNSLMTDEKYAYDENGNKKRM